MFSRKTERTKNGNKKQANIQRKSKKQNPKMLKKTKFNRFILTLMLDLLNVLPFVRKSNVISDLFNAHSTLTNLCNKMTTRN